MPTLKLKALNTSPPDLTSTPRGYDRYKRVYDHIFDTSGLTDELDKVNNLIKRELKQQRKRRRRRSAKSRHQTLLFAGIPLPDKVYTSDDYPDIAAFRRSRVWATWCGWYCFNPQSTTYTWRPTHGWIKHYSADGVTVREIEIYKRRLNRNRKRHPNQSAEFSPSLHMPTRWIAALHAAHDAQAHKLFASFDKCDPDTQILALVLISINHYDRELGLP